MHRDLNTDRRSRDENSNFLHLLKNEGTCFFSDGATSGQNKEVIFAYKSWFRTLTFFFRAQLTAVFFRFESFLESSPRRKRRSRVLPSFFDYVRIPTSESLRGVACNFCPPRNFAWYLFLKIFSLPRFFFVE